MPMQSPDRSLDPRAVTLWRIQRVVRTATAGMFLAVAVGWGARSLLGPTAGWVAAAAVILFNLLFAMIWPALEYRAFRFAVRDDDLLVRSGVLFRRWSSIPHRRIQHVDTRQGPFERLLGLARLQVYTAAGVSADGSIPALDEEDADKLRDELSRRGGDDGV